MENNMKMYACAICGKTHETIPERIKCETECYHKRELDAQKAAEQKKKEERNVRKADVDTAIKAASKLLQDYIADYGHYEIDDLGHKVFDWPSKLIDYFF